MAEPAGAVSAPEGSIAAGESELSVDSPITQWEILPCANRDVQYKCQPPSAVVKCARPLSVTGCSRYSALAGQWPREWQPKPVTLTLGGAVANTAALVAAQAAVTPGPTVASNAVALLPPQRLLAETSSSAQATGQG